MQKGPKYEHLRGVRLPVCVPRSKPNQGSVVDPMRDSVGPYPRIGGRLLPPSFPQNVRSLAIGAQNRWCSGAVDDEQTMDSWPTVKLRDKVGMFSQTAESRIRLCIVSFGLNTVE